MNSCNGEGLRSTRYSLRLHPAVDIPTVLIFWF